MQGEWPPGCRGKSCICAVARECARVACVRPFVDASLSVLSLVLDRYMACGCQSPFCNKHIHHPYLRTLHEIFGVATRTDNNSPHAHLAYWLFIIFHCTVPAAISPRNSPDDCPPPHHQRCPCAIGLHYHNNHITLCCVCVCAARVSFKQIEITGMFRALDASVNSRPTSVDTSKFQAQNISYRYACSVLTGRVMCASRCQHSASTRTNIEIKL